MDKDVAGLAAERYGELNQLRLRAVEAIAAGEYRRAIGISTHALQISHDTLRLFSDLETPAALPHRALASAVLGDLTVARTAAIEMDVPGDVASVELTVRELAEPGGMRTVEAFLPRECPHGLPSYDGYCMTQPCPPA